MEPAEGAGVPQGLGARASMASFACGSSSLWIRSYEHHEETRQHRCVRVGKWRLGIWVNQCETQHGRIGIRPVRVRRRLAGSSERQNTEAVRECLFGWSPSDSRKIDSIKVEGLSSTLYHMREGAEDPIRCAVRDTMFWNRVRSLSVLT